MGKRNQPTIDLYTGDGWVNIPAIADLGSWCNIIIGKRQVGKTYGTLKYLLEKDSHFLYLRRTATEFDAITSDPDLNPFLPFTHGDKPVDIVKGGKITYSIGESELDENGKPVIVKKLGVGMTLNSIAQIRGFNGSQFEEVVYDEFIPERIVVKRKAEGDALLNAYVTINGNRELEGKPPLKIWLLANAFDIGNDILAGLGVTDTIASMARKHEEYRLLDSGVFIAMPQSTKVTDKRAQTAFMRHMAKNKNSKFYQMAMENKFSYNDLTQVRSMSLRGMRPAFKLDDLYVYEYGDMYYYVSHSPHQSREKYAATSTGKKTFRTNYPLFQLCFGVGQVWCEDVPALLSLKNYLDIKD